MSGAVQRFVHYLDCSRRDNYAEKLGINPYLDKEKTMFVALLSYTSRGGFEKVSIVRKNVKDRLVAFETEEEARSAANSAVSNGEVGSFSDRNGRITIVDLSEAGSVSESETPSYTVS